MKGWEISTLVAISCGYGDIMISQPYKGGETATSARR